jgi:type IV pilus assembly protein PilP
MRNSASLLWVAILLLPLSGCDREGPYGDLKAYMAKVKEQQAKVINNEKLDVQLPTQVVYVGNLHRSPFEGGGQVAAATVKSSATTNPLQAYSLNMLRLLGTVTENGATVAYVTAPDNMVYRVQVGDIIGDRHGKVVSIQPGNVSVMELDADNPDEKMQRVVSLKLREET